MKAFILIHFILFLFYSCSGGKSKKENINNNTTITKENNNSIPFFESDTIYKNDLNSYLKIRKIEDEFLVIDYKLKIEEKEHSIKIKYFSTSDIIFPEKGIGILSEKKIKLERYYVFKDSILFLPIIGVNNCLSTYIIDLKNEDILDNDIRTSLSYLWLSSKKKLELTMSDTPEITDSSYKYVLRKYEFDKNKLKRTKLDSILLKKDLKLNLKKEYKIIKKF